MSNPPSPDGDPGEAVGALGARAAGDGLRAKMLLSTTDVIVSIATKQIGVPSSPCKIKKTLVLLCHRSHMFKHNWFYCFFRSSMLNKPLVLLSCRSTTLTNKLFYCVSAHRGSKNLIHVVKRAVVVQRIDVLVKIIVRNCKKM